MRLVLTDFSIETLNVYNVVSQLLCSGGEKKDDFCRIVDYCTNLLPEGKPRYLMGVGYAEDLVVCVALGIDMFDCVFPTRTAVSTNFACTGRLILHPMKE